MRNKRAITILETLIAFSISLPLIWAIHDAHIFSRRAEKSTIGRSAALRGSILLSRLLRRDLSRLCVETAATPIEFDGLKLTLRVVVPDENARLKRLVAAYILRPAPNSAFTVERDGHKLQGVLVSGFNVEVGTSLVNRMVAIDFETLDPGGGAYSHSTRVLTCVPWSPPSNDWIDYASVDPINSSTATAWIEGMSDSFIHLGAFAPKSPMIEPPIALRVDTHGPCLIEPEPNATTKETVGPHPYTRLSLRYGPSLESLLGPSALTEPHDLTFAVQDPDDGIFRIFHSGIFYPGPTVQRNPGEVFVRMARLRLDGAAPDMEIWLDTLKPGRSCYLLGYTDDDGTWRVARCPNLGNGSFSCTLENLTSYDALSRVHFY